MDALEALIGNTLAEHATDAPSVECLGAGLVGRTGPARRPWVYAALTAAAVAVIALGGAAVTAPPPPPGTKPVSYHGITVYVPKRLAVTDVNCGPRPNSVLTVDPGFGAKCAPLSLNPQPPGIRIVLEPADYGTGGKLPPYGRPERREVNGVGTSVAYASTAFDSITARVTLAVPAIRLEVTALTRAAVDAIVSTLRRTPVDSVGCSSAVASVVPQNPSSASLVPGSPVSAIVCDYVERENTETDPSGWLLGSFRLSTQTTTRVARTLRELPSMTGLIHIVPTLPRWIVFRYADGSTRTVVVQRHFYPSQVTDGQIFARDEDGALAELRPG